MKRRARSSHRPPPRPQRREEGPTAARSGLERPTYFETVLRGVNPEANPVVASLEASGVRYALVGSLAVNTFLDDDQLAARTVEAVAASEDLDKLLAELSRVLPGSRGRLRHGEASLLHSSRKRPEVAHLTASAASPLHELALKGARRRRVPGIGGARVAPIEVLTALKVLATLDADRRPADVSYDQADVLGLIPQVDVRKTRALLIGFAGAREAFDDLVANFRGKAGRRVR